LPDISREISHSLISRALVGRAISDASLKRAAADAPATIKTISTIISLTIQTM
jgi:hypothetical protein